MSKAAKYAVSGLSIVALVTLVSWPFLDPAGRRGVVIAGAVALPIQVTAFWALLRFRGQLNGFLAAWAGGTLLRMLVIAAVAVYAIRSSVGERYRCSWPSQASFLDF